MPLFQGLESQVLLKGQDELGIIIIQVAGDSLSEYLVIMLPLLVQELD